MAGLAIIILVSKTPLYTLVVQNGAAGLLPKGLPLAGRVIAVDAGHGGYDPGVMRDGLPPEAEINLAVSLFLREYLEQAGAMVVMMREDDRDLLTPEDEKSGGRRKPKDLANRVKLAREWGSQILLSIHVNSFPSPVWSGAQAFYYAPNEDSRVLSNLIQDEIARVLANTTRRPKPMDYYLLREAAIPAAYVEIGFITNPGEAALLTKPEYQRKMAWAVYLGVLRYFHEGLPSIPPAGSLAA